MVTQTKTLTAKDLLRMPDDGFRYELVQGELRKMPPAAYEHGRIAVNLTVPLGHHVRANNLGVVLAAETGFLLITNPDTVRAPDVAFISEERLASAHQVKSYWPGAPDLAAEVLSPGDSYSEVQEKVFDWLGAGTRIVLVVDPRRRTVTVYRSPASVTILTESDVLACDDVVPGWTVPVKELFV